MTAPYHARYFVHELTRQHGPGGADRLSMALFDACVDVNPYQIEAALLALRSPISKGVIRGIRVVEGTNPDGERVLGLWRNLDETSNDKLDDWFEKQGYSTRDLKYDLVYMNGDNNLENLRRNDQTWKVRLIEDECQRLMFDAEEL